MTTDPRSMDPPRLLDAGNERDPLRALLEAGRSEIPDTARGERIMASMAPLLVPTAGAGLATKAAGAAATKVGGSAAKIAGASTATPLVATTGAKIVAAAKLIVFSKLGVAVVVGGLAVGSERADRRLSIWGPRRGFAPLAGPHSLGPGFARALDAARLEAIRSAAVGSARPARTAARARTDVEGAQLGRLARAKSIEHRRTVSSFNAVQVFFARILRADRIAVLRHETGGRAALRDPIGATVAAVERGNAAGSTRVCAPGTLRIVVVAAAAERDNSRHHHCHHEATHVVRPSAYEPSATCGSQL